MSKVRYRKRRARSLYAFARLVLAVALVLAAFVLATLAGAGRMYSGQWAGLAVVAVLTSTSLVGMALAHRIEYPPVEVLPADALGRYADGRPAYPPPAQRGPLVEPSEILPARNRE